MIAQPFTCIKRTGLLAASVLLLSANSPSVWAENFAEKHPRRAQVVRRDVRQNRRINNDRGHLNGHYQQLKGQNQAVRRQERQDANRNGGVITRGQQNQLNREENAMGQERKYDNTNNAFVDNHPRRSEVMSRDANLNYSINKDDGHLNGQYNNLERQDNSIARQQRQDAQRNGGFITTGQQNQLNREENALGQERKYDNTNNSFVQNHPRRSEVMSRDANLNYSINKDDGHLDGQYSRLEKEDKSIDQQEARDARADGGVITQSQQTQLNREENSLRNQVKRDDTPQ